MKYTVNQIKEIVKNATSVGELHDLTEELDRVYYPDKDVKEIARLMTERLIEINGV